jgi:hypothetical protein
MTDSRKRKQTRRRHSYRRHRGGAKSVSPPNHFSAKYLLIVPTALDAIVYTGANLLAAPGWCVVCDTGDEKRFYKSMSRMGVNDYYYGFSENMDNLFNLDWCGIYTTSSGIIERYNSQFKKQMKLLDTSPSEMILNGKLNRAKTIEINRMEKIMHDEGYAIAELEQDADADVNDNLKDIVEQLRNNGEDVVVMNENTVSIPKIMNSLQASKTIIYLPSTTEDRFANRLRMIIDTSSATFNESKRLDFLFVDRRTIKKNAPLPAYQYMFQIDTEQPMLIRSQNYVIRKLFGILKNFKELETIFNSSYQFLSRLRMGELRPVKTKKSASAQSGGAEDFEESEESDDPLDLIYGVGGGRMVGGTGQRRRRHFSFRRRERGEKLKHRPRRLSFRKRFRQRK